MCPPALLSSSHSLPTTPALPVSESTMASALMRGSATDPCHLFALVGTARSMIAHLRHHQQVQTRLSPHPQHPPGHAHSPTALTTHYLCSDHRSGSTFQPVNSQRSSISSDQASLLTRTRSVMIYKPKLASLPTCIDFLRSSSTRYGQIMVRPSEHSDDGSPAQTFSVSYSPSFVTCHHQPQQPHRRRHRQ